MEDFKKELLSTRTQELKDLLNGIEDALSKLMEENHLNYLLFTRVKEEIEKILVEREVNILLNSLTLYTFSERVNVVRGMAC